MVDWSVATAKAATDGVVLVLSADDPHLSAGDGRGADVVVEGGETRSASVRAGLEALPEYAEIVVIHDGARPLAPVSLFKEVVEAVRAGAGAAVPALDLADTVKRVRGDVVLSTVEREELKVVQTPQAFRAQVIRGAHLSGVHATDDAGLVEQMGVVVHVVPGDRRNLKVTTPADLELVQALAGP